MHKEDSEVSDFRSQLRAPRDLALQHHLVGIDVVQMGSFGQKEHSLFRKEPFLLVKDSLLDNEVTFHESVVFVALRLFLDSGIKFQINVTQLAQVNSSTGRAD